MLGQHHLTFKQIAAVHLSGVTMSHSTTKMKGESRIKYCQIYKLCIILQHAVYNITTDCV